MPDVGSEKLVQWGILSTLCLWIPNNLNWISNVTAAADDADDDDEGDYIDMRD